MHDAHRQGTVLDGGVGVSGLKLHDPVVVIVKDCTTMKMSKKEAQAATDEIDKILGVGNYKTGDE